MEVGKLLTQVDLKEPTPLLDQENSPCTLRECKPNLKIVQENKNVFESLISASAAKQLPGMERSHVDILACSHNVEDKAQKCVEKCCELTSKNNKQLDQVSSSNACKNFASIGRPDFLMVHEKPDKSYHQRNTARGKRLARFIPYIHFTSGYRQYGKVGNTASKSKLCLFQDRDFACDIADSKSTSGGVLCALGSHTSVPISWTCKKKKKQTAVSHSSAAAEIISFDTV